jgi:hypothetical protein
MPDKLRELYEAVQRDGFLFQECFARAALALDENTVRAVVGASEPLPIPGLVAGVQPPGSAAEAPFTERDSGSEVCLDAWEPQIGLGEPRPRAGHTAVWTGSEMIVWGGSDRVGELATGARYDPATDTWTPTSTVGAPSPMEGHTAVWTGKEMIVWGPSGRNQASRDDILGPGVAVPPGVGVR